MHVLSNGFPTNMPDSENVSQGGPANFAKLFVSHIVSDHKEHQWTGVILKGVSSSSVRLQKVFSAAQRSYYCLNVSRFLLQKVAQAKSAQDDPSVILQKSIARLTALIKEQKPDVVFLNGFGFLNWMLLKAAEAANTPVVVQHAGIWTKEIDIHKKLYTAWGRKLMKKMEQDSTRLTKTEIFLNAWSRDYYHRHVAKGPANKTIIIPLPFDFNAFQQLSCGAPSRAFDFNRNVFHIGIIARWDKIKNHKAILAIAKKAAQKKLPWKFHSIVDIPDRKEYQKTKSEYETFIDIIPPVDRAGISDFCRSVNMLILPSLFDVSPTVVLEAMATNTPIIISPTIGYVRDFYAHGGKELVIDPADAEKATQRISSLMRKRIPAALKKQLLSMHDHKKVFASYLEIFTKISQGSAVS